MKTIYYYHNFLKLSEHGGNIQEIGKELMLELEWVKETRNKKRRYNRMQRKWRYIPSPLTPSTGLIFSLRTKYLEDEEQEEK